MELTVLDIKPYTLELFNPKGIQTMLHVSKISLGMQLNIKKQINEQNLQEQ